MFLPQDRSEPLHVKGPGFYSQCPITSISGNRVAPPPTAALACGSASKWTVLQPRLQTEESRLYRGRSRATVRMCTLSLKCFQIHRLHCVFVETVCSQLHQNLAFVCCWNSERVSHPTWVVTWGLPHCLFSVRTLHSGNLPSACVQSYSDLFFLLSSLRLLQHISQRTAFSGCGRDAPGRPAGGGGGRVMAELWKLQQVMPWDRTWKKRRLLLENDRLLFLHKHLITENSSGNALKYT